MRYRVELGSEVHWFPSMNAAVDWLEGRLQAMSGYVSAHVFDQSGRAVALMSRDSAGDIVFSFV